MFDDKNRHQTFKWDFFFLLLVVHCLRTNFNIKCALFSQLYDDFSTFHCYFLSFFACFICYSNVIFVDIFITFSLAQEDVAIQGIYTLSRCFNHKFEIKINAKRFPPYFQRRYGRADSILSECKIGKVLSQADLFVDDLWAKYSNRIVYR